MSDLLKRLETLSPEKRELVLKKLKQQQQSPLLKAGSREHPLRLSFAQQRLWFIDQLEGENCVYNVPFFWYLSGLLNINALEKAIAKIVQRHEVLRTSFSVVDELPIQVIQTHFALDMQVLDWRQLTEEDSLNKAQQFAIAELQQSFDLSKAPLLRVKLIQLTDQSYLLLLVIHHIVCDGWSMDIFRQELFSLYTAFCDEKPSPLPPLTLQYADFSQWQRQWLQGEVLQNQLNYWQKQLADIPPLLELPTDQPRPSVQSFKGSSEFLELNQDLTQKLKQLSQESKTTLFMTLLTVFTLLLSRYSGQEDIVIGSAIANRNRREIEPLIGFFVNTLALRINLQENPTFLELLERVKQVTLDAYDHQDLPFEKLVDELGLERSLSHHPLFQVAFGLQQETQQQLEINGLTLTPFKWENTTTLFDLSLIFRETTQGLIGEWEYATDLFEAKTIQRMIRHFAVLLQAIVDNPQQSINTLPLMTEVEYQQLQNWNQTQTNYSHNQTLVDVFEQQVKKHPNNLALFFENQCLTYQQLNQKANQLAHYLIKNYQIQPDTLIGISVERSLDMIIGVLGILKAGAAYLPIDPNYPPERIKFILEDSGVSVLLTQRFLTEKLPLTHLKHPVICLDQDAFTQELTDNPSPQSTPENLAYIIYTSGSTGQPKGVMIEHKAIVNLALSWGETFQVKSHSRLLQFGSFSFDLSIGEIATALSNGACLYLADQDTLLPSQTLVNFLTKHKITHSFLSPSTLSILPEAPLNDLEILCVGGEDCPAELVNKWGTKHRLYNCYGPTEATVNAAIALCQPNGKKSPIGKPLSNVRIYILDRHHQPLTPGIPGELCIAGVGLARGYLNRPETTAEKFIEIELFGKPERIYKTGDFARWNDDGKLEYLRRIDEQIKLRGFRIELGEIESLLLQHSLVKEAVVILSKAENNPRLVAYITTVEKSINLGSQLKDYLKNSLPHYMIPSQILILDRLPLTPNGKIDRKTLSTLDLPSSTHNFEKPVTLTEERLANLWQNLLNRQPINRGDHFFELGGHSLLATQLVARIRDSFGVELPVRKIFEYSVLSELAEQIDQASASVTLATLTPQPENAPKSLSYAQSRLWFLDQLEGVGTSITYNMSTALQLEGQLNLNALRASFDDLLQRHETLRTYFPAVEGQPQVAVRNLEEMEGLEIVDLQSLTSETQAEMVQQLSNRHAQEPFNLNTGPLFKAQLLQLSDHKNVLLINMHHIISDGWSMGVFKREWEQAYTAYTAGHEPNLSPLPIQYSDYAAWQRQYLQGEILSSQENYWKQQLGDAPQLLELPTDYPRPAQQSYQGQHQESYLSSELTQKLKTLSQQHGVTLFMTLLTAFNILLSRYSRQNDLCLGTAVANRTHPNTEELIGFFVNTLVLRSRIKVEQKFSELLQQTRQTCLEAYSHQDIPFEYLVEQLQPERSLSHNPLFQVMMVLQNTQEAGKNVRLPGLNIEYLEQNLPFSKFDLTLDLCERNGQLYCTWEYATDLFKPETIQRMATHFEVLLTAIVQNPQQLIYQLPLITPAEIQQLQIWNQTDINNSDNSTLITLFEEQVLKTPDQIAVVFENHSLTYQELNQKANQLAHYLLEVQKSNQQFLNNPLVGICAERSLSLIIGILAILKAGAAYIPIDPNYPQERIHFMLEDSHTSVLLTTHLIYQQILQSKLNNSCEIVFLDAKTDVNQSIENPPPQSSPDDLAYIIYTSGSTGRPKGVTIAHSSSASFVKWAHSVYSPEQLAGVLASTSICFDLSIFEIFVPLTQGGTVIMVENALYIEQADQSPVQITLINTVPSAATELLNLNRIPSTVQVINLAGEPLKNRLVQGLYQIPSIQEVYNLYGPSEDTTYSTFTKVAKNVQEEPTIGKAIANTRIYILDHYNQLLPPGIPGELCIAGAGLASCYLNRPDLTAEKFITLELFNQLERIYKTGDLARWLPDGNLQYLGRIDHQIKLRGFRIELGEIEAALLKHPNIKEAVVRVRTETDLDQRLVAYIVPASNADQSLQTEQVELWQQVFNEAYHQPQTPKTDPTLNLASWNDSYTGQPLADEVMQEWRDTTVEQILELEPKRVWEMGCGTGLLLLKIAPYCQKYLGTDIAASGLDYIKNHLHQQSLQDKVTLKQSAAHDFNGIETDDYDLVILNSVIQYFPSVDYLLSVLEGAIKIVKNQGKILIGDVRNLHLLEAFHTATQCYRAPDELSIQDLRQQIQNSIRTEGELLIAPDLFKALKQKFHRISHVQIQLKRGYSHTEMSRFRYDVVLYLDGTETSIAELQELDYQQQPLNLEIIKNRLITQEPDLLRIKNISNPRLTSEMELLEKITQLEGTVGELKAATPPIKLGIEPEAFRTLTRNLSYTAFIEYSSKGFAYYDVILQKNIPGLKTLPKFHQREKRRQKPWQHYANQPLKSSLPQVDSRLLEEWRENLAKTLPDYMIPSHFIVLEKLPLTPNGKIDIQALLAINQTAVAREIDIPITETEKLLAQVWAQLLKYEAIARQDNFFNLGGHSLLATQLIARIRDIFKVELALRKIFEFPILSELATYLDACIWANTSNNDIQPLNSDEEEIEL